MMCARRISPSASSSSAICSRTLESRARTSKISPTGVLGNPTVATAEKGRRMWEIMVTNLVELVEELKGMTLDEIYERRY